MTNWNTENAMLMNIATMNVCNATNMRKRWTHTDRGTKPISITWEEQTVYYLYWGNDAHTKVNTVNYFYWGNDQHTKGNTVNIREKIPSIIFTRIMTNIRKKIPSIIFTGIMTNIRKEILSIIFTGIMTNIRQLSLLG